MLISGSSKIPYESAEKPDIDFFLGATTVESTDASIVELESGIFKETLSRFSATLLFVEALLTVFPTIT